MLTYDLIADVYPAAFAATRGVACRHDEGKNHPHRSRLTKRQQNQSGNQHHSRRQQKSKSQSPLRQYTEDSCDTPGYTDSVQHRYPEEQEILYDTSNNNDRNRLDLNNLKVMFQNSLFSCVCIESLIFMCLYWIPSFPKTVWFIFSWKCRLEGIVRMI